jgi:hypothetical protein
MRDGSPGCAHRRGARDNELVGSAQDEPQCGVSKAAAGVAWLAGLDPLLEPVIRGGA